MKIAVVGATGLVGQTILKVLEKQNLPITHFLAIASEKSIGKTIFFQNQPHKVISLEEGITQKPDIAIFSAGGDVSKKYAPLFAENGTVVIDNSSAWRMEPNIPLVVPEINAHILTPQHKIIANPNCSTIQMVMALAPLHQKYGIKRLVISTYQAVTGTGMKAVQQLENERQGKTGPMAYHYPIDKNCIPHCDVFLDNGYTKEEMKLVNETKKILNDPNIAITATAVRVPVVGGHSETVNVELKKPFVLEEIKAILANTQGLKLLDDISKNIYPMPILAQNTDEVYVGRIRRDESLENAINIWIVADNLRKGAATNAVQIAKYLIDHQLIKA